jgi:hypothetical protein
MQDETANGRAEQAAHGNGPCGTPFLLCQLKEGEKDKLGHIVEEILWIGQEYAIYRSEAGVYVQFSDSRDAEKDQREKFTQISPELCELRYLTYEMRSSWILRFFSRMFGLSPSRHPSYLFDHNIAQAVMLVMEGINKEGQDLAQETLKMAVQRVSNDNTVEYFKWCAIVWLGLVLAGGAALHYRPSHLMVAAIFGATGAMLSVAIRLRDFKLQPCQQSNMNYLLSATRIAIGFIGGPLLLLLASTILSEQMTKVFAPVDWRGAAVLGLIGGFSERLIPNLLEQTVGQIEPQAGTPVQALRNEPRPVKPAGSQPA